MLGKLDNDQIEGLLYSQNVGRIGCHANDITYVVPVNYAYDGVSIYSHSGAGMKINMLRRNPNVCFQVDVIKDIQDWQSVIVWGRYVEIENMDEKQVAMQLINDTIADFLTSASGHPSHGITENASDVNFDHHLVLYKIKISQKTGRFEKHL